MQHNSHCLWHSKISRYTVLQCIQNFNYPPNVSL